MPQDEAVPALDLAELVERLRQADFRVDTRQYLIAHELLLAYAASHVRLDQDTDRLSACLGPIFCTSPEEQTKFAREVVAWRGQDRAQPVAPGPGPRPAEDKPFRPWRRARWGLRVLLALIPISIVGALLLVRYYVPFTETGRVEVQLDDGRVVPPAQSPGTVEFLVDGRVVALASDGTFSVRVARARPVTLEARLAGYQDVTRELTAGGPESLVITLVRAAPAPPPDPIARVPSAGVPDLVAIAYSGESTDRRIRWGIVAASSVATAVIAFLVLWLIDRIRHRLVLRQLPVHGDPESVTLPVPEVPILPTSEHELNRVAVALRRPREGVALDLDVAETVDLTVRNAGFFQPCFSPRRAMPEYVVLISRRSAADHQARTFDAVLAHLSHQDVMVDTYSFVDDPRTCSSDRTGQSYGLRDVLERHHRATLIVAAETICAFNRATGRLAAWVAATGSHVSRIFLTTEAPDRWTDLEYALEGTGFVVVPASPAGWRALASVDGPSPAELLFPAPYTRAYPTLLANDELRWLDRNEPPVEMIDKLVRELRSFLGPDGFVWMCGCAVYPEISWALTLSVRGTASPSATLPSLARLPWFRHGFMPAWLRRALVARIPADRERQLRIDLERLLEDLARGPRRRDSGSALHIGRWLGPLDLIRAAPPGSPLHDRVFLGFMTGARDSLWLDAPRALRWLFKRQPGALPSEGQANANVVSFARRIAARIRYWTALNPVTARAATASLVGLLAVGPFVSVLAIERVTGSLQTMWFAEIPEGSFRGSASNVVNLRAFFISRTEVTVGQYRACVADGACPQLLGGAGEDARNDRDDWPVRYVPWRQALQYCDWLETKLRAVKGASGPIADALEGRRDGVPWKVTLPSEAEWEKAATGGSPRKYPWGDGIDRTRASYNFDDKMSAPTAVGSFPRGMSPFGLVDMSGNAAEWTRTAYVGQFGLPYRFDDGRDSVDRSAGVSRVIRGGGFLSDPSTLETTFRLGVAPEAVESIVGFRVAIVPLSAPPLTPPPVTPPPITPPGNSGSASPGNVGRTPPGGGGTTPCVPRTDGPFPPVYFAANSASLSPRGQEILQGIASQLRKQPGVLTIEGHVPAPGTNEYNLALAERMASSVRDYLISLGIASSRLRTISRGEEDPQCPNDTEQGRNANRRVEFTFRSGNSAPVISGIARSPSGLGLVATRFTFIGSGVTDPDGDALTYAWTTTFGTPIASTTGNATKVFDRTGTFAVTLTVTDPSGLSASASTQVTIGSLDGTWDMSCDTPPQGFPSFPRTFVATIRQNNLLLSGTMTGGGLTQSFPAPPDLTSTNIISDPRTVRFGVETAYNVWAARDGDFYFSLTVDDRLETMIGTSQYCREARAIKRRPSAR